MDRVSADLMDLYQSYSGNRHVLSIVDHLSRYLQLPTLPDKQSKTFAHTYIMLFGAPKILVLGNGYD